MLAPAHNWNSCNSGIAREGHNPQSARSGWQKVTYRPSSGSLPAFCASTRSAEGQRIAETVRRSRRSWRIANEANLFVLLDVHRHWRKVKVTEVRAARDYAQCMRDLVDLDYPDADIIRVVQDNLSTHSGGTLYQAFPPAEARRIWRRLEFHYPSPKCVRSMMRFTLLASSFDKL